jgi:hypothetical protein
MRVFAVKSRRVNCQGDGRFTRCVNIIMGYAARNVHDVAGFEIDAIVSQNQMTLPSQYRYSRIVELVQMRNFAIAYLHDVLAGALRAA